VKINPQLRGGKTSEARADLASPEVLPPGAVILWGWRATPTPKRQMPTGCRFIAQSPKDFRPGGKWSFCQQQQRRGSSYCQAHALMCESGKS